MSVVVAWFCTSCGCRSTDAKPGAARAGERCHCGAAWYTTARQSEVQDDRLAAVGKGTACP